MQITIPKDVGGELELLPEGPCRGTIEGLSIGTSKEGKPKATFRWVILTELYPKGDKEHTTIGKRVLETFSLQEQALWNINGFYKEVTGENLPQGDYNSEQLQAILEDAFKGIEANLVLGTETTPDGEPQTRVSAREVVK